MFALVVDDDISLRLSEERDAEALFALVDSNRARLREWMPWLDGTQSPDDTRAFIRGTRTQFAEGRAYEVAIRYRGQLAGRIGLRVTSTDNRVAELGYWVAAEYEGRGIITRSARALTTAAFAELALHRVQIQCATGNLLSRAVPERLGFSLEGVHREAEWLYDHFVDHAVYAILEQDWAPDTPN